MQKLKKYKELYKTKKLPEEIKPLFENAVEKTALSEANRISQYKDMISPTPAAGPLMAAMIGFGTDGK